MCWRSAGSSCCWPTPGTSRPHTAETQRIHKTLEDASIRLGSVASDVLGVSGRAMLRALLAGERDPATLADLARGRLRNKLPELREALRGRFDAHHALLLRLALEHVEQLERSIAALDAEVDRVIAPFARARDHLDTITGVGKRAAECIIAEPGSPGAAMRWGYPTGTSGRSRCSNAPRAGAGGPCKGWPTSPSCGPTCPPPPSGGWTSWPSCASCLPPGRGCRRPSAPPADWPPHHAAVPITVVMSAHGQVSVTADLGQHPSILGE